MACAHSSRVRSGCRLRHPHIVRLHGAYMAGTVSRASARTLKLVLEYVDGGTLEERIERLREALSGSERL